MILYLNFKINVFSHNKIVKWPDTPNSFNES